MTNKNCLLGQLFIDWQLATAEQINASMEESICRNLPIGLVLIMRNVIETETLHAAVAAQSFLRDQLISAEQAKSVLALVQRKRIPFGLAMDFLRIEPATKPRNRLGDYLVESGSIDRKQLKSRIALSKATGVNLGRVLTVIGDVHNDVIKHALVWQIKVRNGDVDRDDAIGGLYSQRRCLDAITKVSHESTQNQSRLGQLVILSGLAKDKDIILALCISKEQKMPLGEALVALNCVSPAEINAALEIQRLIRDDKISINNGIERLKSLCSNGDMLDSDSPAATAAESGNISFYCFLKLTGVLPRIFETNAWSPEGAKSNRILEAQIEETWEELHLAYVPHESAPQLPEDVRDLLSRQGFLSDAQQLTAQRAAAAYKMIRERRITIEQGLIQFRCLESIDADPGTWTGTFPTLPTLQ